jgi:V8-like Glu-specific endopeptidase
MPYGQQQQEKVLMRVIPGEDGRIRIEKTTEWPYLFHGQLEMSYSDKNLYGGSGVLVGPQHILTAAHNIYDYKDKKGWAQKVVVRLGLNDKVAHYGEALAKRMYTFEPWVKTGDPAHDMALLVLDKPIGMNTGWCGLLAASSKDLQEHKMNITGYPGDKGLKEMWTMCHNLKEVRDEQLIYEIDTYAGQSGSGIWLNKWGSPYVIGIHTLGEDPMNKLGNAGVRLSYTKAKQVMGWINQTLGLKEYIKDLPIQFLSEVTIDALAIQARKGDSPSLQKLLDASHINHVYVQLVLGRMYEEGAGVTKDLKQAAAFYQKAADQGFANAQSNLGWMYCYGYGVQQDYNQAIAWYQKAADQGNAFAQDLLGDIYYYGYGVQQDYNQAREWYQKAADQGHVKTQVNLHKMDKCVIM